MAVYGNFKGTTQPGFTVGKIDAATIHGNPSSAPASPTTGDVWMDSANTALRIYDGSDWDNGEFIGNLDGYMQFDAVAGEDLIKGDLVYVSGNAGNMPIVSKAQANASGLKMPSFGVCKQTINSGNVGYIVTQGLLTGINTSSFTAGDTLYVSETVAGAITNIAPSGEENKIQNIGKCVRSAGGGSILVGGSGRFNATNALDQGNIFLGNANDQSVTANLDLSVAALGYTKESPNVAVLGGYVFTQSSASTTWTVNHDLLQQYLNVDVVNSNGQSLAGTMNYPVIEYVSDTQLTATFATPTSGYLVASAGTGPQGNVGFVGSTGNVGFTGSQGVGFTGSKGDSSVVGGYVFTQSANASVWTVTHDLGQQFLNVEVVDSSGESLSGTSNYPVVEFVSANVLTATFTTPSSGSLVASAGTGGQGVTGFDGSIGFTGSIGYTGSKGDQGDVGFNGSIGDQGLIGFTGSQGDQGVIGYTGSKGDIGFTGSQGDQGVIGYTGSKGDQGIQGFTGSQGIQGVIGYTGSKGDQGDVGFNGSTGIQGPIGYTGSKGNTGFTGSASTVQGPIGYTGSASTVQGPIGYTGSRGVIGYTGSKGNTGFNGSAGAENATLDSVTDNGSTTTNNITVGNIIGGDGTNIAQSGAATGQYRIDGDGYAGAIALDGTAMRIYHNSTSRSLILGTNETDRLTINGSTGDVTIANDLNVNGVVQTTTLTSGSSSTVGTLIGDWSLTSGSTLTATYADVAEKYHCDKEYDPGTVMVFGGDKEVTECTESNDRTVMGVISTNPAYMMNSEANGQYVAIAGRVPVKVVGEVMPGDMLVASATPGCAEVNNDPKVGTIIGKAVSADANGMCEALVILM